LAPRATAPRSWATIAILVLLLPQLVGALVLFPHYTFTQADTDLQVFAVGVALFSLLTVAGLWLGRPWALWATLVFVSCKATIMLFAWSTDFDRIGPLISAPLLAVIVVLVFREAVAPVRQVTAYQRALYGCVFAFAAWVAVWGLFLPAQIGSRLPLTVPPMHARFLGAMYLSGSVFMLFAMLAREWHEVRVATVILAVWTGMLGLISVLNLSAFDWSRGPLWFWFVAYIGFPLVALWIAWCQRSETAHPDVEPISGALRAYFYVQGAVAVPLAVCLVLAPSAMTTVWPWSIPALVAHIYGAPFLAYGLGSLYAARQRSWSEVRIVVYGTLVFALSVLIASTLHANLFDPRSPSAWLWFGAFGLATVALTAFALLPSLRSDLAKRVASP
jgi:hypothetical protein